VPAVEKGIEVLEFLPLEAIDPVYFDRSYYLEPQKLAAKPYVLLRDALRQSGRVAIAKVVLRQREALSVLRVHADVMILNTMLWPDEVRTPTGFDFLRDPSAQVRDQELKMAVALIDSLSEDAFEPAKYHDTYREALQDIIAAKVAGRDTTAPIAAGADMQAVDLMTALRASVQKAREHAAADNAGAGRAAPKNKARPATKKTQKKAAAKTVPAPRTPKSASVPAPRTPKRASAPKAKAGRQSK
jgi:DNA end-binding protein Ku